MLISEVELRNFRNIEHFLLENARNNITITGLIGQGKSSILYAIQYALFGFCEKTSSNGRGYRDLIKKGQESASIRIRLGDYTITSVLCADKTVSEVFEVINDDGEILAEDRTTFWRNVLKKDQGLAVISCMPMESLRTNSITGALSGFLSGSLTEDAILGSLRENVTWLKNYAKEKNFTKLDVDHLISLGKLMDEDRKTLKKYIADVEKEKKLLGFTPPPKDSKGNVLSGADIPKVTKAIEQLNNKWAGLHVDLGKATTGKCIDEVRMIRTKAEEDLAEWQKKASDIAQTYITCSDLYSVTETHYRTASEAHATTNMQITETRSALDRLKKTLRTYDVDTCPFCKEELSSDSFTAMIESLEQEKTGLEDTLNDLVNQANKDLKAVSATREDMSVEKKRLDETVEEQRQIATALGSAKAAMENIPIASTGENPEEIKEAIDTVGRKLEAAQSALSDINKRKDTEGLDNVINKSKYDLKLLNWGIKQFRDGEAFTAIIGPRLDEFCIKVNTELTPHNHLLTYKVKGKTIEFFLNDLRLPLCSNGEMMLAAHSIAIAFSDDSLLIMLDNVNELDYEARPLVQARLAEACKTSAILAYAIQDDNPFPASDNVTKVLMKGGVGRCS